MQDDGLLRASDIFQLKLNADWVVLSACNTASSDGIGAEALSGLARAFFYAGARSLIVSHWEVNDAAAVKLMSALFSISSNNPALSHGEALQSAEIQLLSAARTDAEAHPRYWATLCRSRRTDEASLNGGKALSCSATVERYGIVDASTMYPIQSVNHQSGCTCWCALTCPHRALASGVPPSPSGNHRAAI